MNLGALQFENWEDFYTYIILADCDFHDGNLYPNRLLYQVPIMLLIIC